MEIRYLDVEDLLGFVRVLEAGPVRDVGLLDAGAVRPASNVFGADAYPTLALKAAALLHSVAGNHALVDGNKRLGWLATVVFLDVNGAVPGVTRDGAFDLVMAVARGEIEVDEIAHRLRVRRARRRGAVRG